jgi:hypothetical protein
VFSPRSTSPEGRWWKESGLEVVQGEAKNTSCCNLVWAFGAATGVVTIVIAAITLELDLESPEGRGSGLCSSTRSGCLGAGCVCGCPGRHHLSRKPGTVQGPEGRVFADEALLEIAAPLRRARLVAQGVVLNTLSCQTAICRKATRQLSPDFAANVHGGRATRRGFRWNSLTPWVKRTVGVAAGSWIERRRSVLSVMQIKGTGWEGIRFWRVSRLWLLSWVSLRMWCLDRIQPNWFASTGSVLTHLPVTSIRSAVLAVGICRERQISEEY